MGNSNSDTKEKPSTYMHQNLHLVKQIENDAFGQVILMKNDLNGEVVAVKNFSFQSEEKLQEFIARAERRKNLISPYITELFDIEMNRANDFCSSFIKLSLIYQFHAENLDQLMEKRKTMNKIFTESEVFFLIECICSALLVFEQLGIKHGDIRPQTILISADGQCKLTDVQFLTQFSQYQRLLIGESSTNYLSPFLFQQIEHRIANPDQSQSTSQNDIFSLGLVCLEMITKTAIQDIYNWETYVISEEMVEGLLQKAVNLGYSNSLIEIIIRMLQINPEERITLEEILTDITPLRHQFWNSRLAFTTNRQSDLTSTHSIYRHPLTAQHDSKSHRSVIPEQQYEPIESVKRAQKNQETPNLSIYNRSTAAQQPRSNNALDNDVKEYWQQSVQVIEDDVQSVLNETLKIQNEYSQKPKVDFSHDEIDILISKHLNTSRQEANPASYMTNSARNQPKYSIEPVKSSAYGYTHMHSTTLSPKKYGEESYQLQKSFGNPVQIATTKQHLHSDTKSLRQAPTSNSQLHRSYADEYGSSTAIPMQQDYIDRSKGNPHNPFDISLNEYKRQLNQQNQFISSNGPNIY